MICKIKPKPPYILIETRNVEGARDVLATVVAYVETLYSDEIRSIKVVLEASSEEDARRLFKDILNELTSQEVKLVKLVLK